MPAKFASGNDVEHGLVGVGDQVLTDLGQMLAPERRATVHTARRLAANDLAGAAAGQFV
jgi:hypothetical protein